MECSPIFSLLHELTSLTIIALNASNNFLFCHLLRLLKGRSIPGKVLLTRRLEMFDNSGVQHQSPSYQRSYSENDAGRSNDADKYMEVMLRVNSYCVSTVPKIIIVLLVCLFEVL